MKIKEMTSAEPISIAQETIAKKLIQTIIDFLSMFIQPRLAKRIACLFLLISGVPNKRITQMTGVCDRTVRTFKKSIENGEIDDILTVGRGGGRKSKCADIEAGVIAEIEKGNYHTLRQIADMIEEKFGIKMSLPAVSRLVKKTASES